MMPPQLDAILAELRVAPDYRPLLSRLLACAGSRAGDLAQEFALRLLEAREAGLPEPESVALAAARRWLKRARIDAALLEPLALPDDDGKERERRLEPLPCPIPAARRQIRWGRRDDTLSIPAPAPDADLVAAVKALPLPERRAIQACFGVTGPKRRGRRSREVLRLAERAVERLRQALPPEHFAVNLF
jgi:hypothetical protein